MSSQSLVLSKIVGTGNDFLFVDARKGVAGPFGEISRGDLAKKVCDRNFGIGADGLVFVENGSAGAELKWDFYNNDGSHAEMCGNASRCMGRWAQIKLTLDSVTFDTVAGRVRTRVSGSDVEAHIDYLQIQFTELEFELVDKKQTAIFINTGVPHAVFEVANIRDARQAKGVIQALRFHPDVGPRGTNVTFLQRAANVATGGGNGGRYGQAATVTFERGVEDFTLSCGTGVMAAAAVALRNEATSQTHSIKLSTPGGLLEVSYGKNWSGAVLKGPAISLFDVSISEQFLG